MRFYRMLLNSILLLIALILIVVFFAAAEEYRVLVAGTAADSITVSVVVSEAISISSPSNVLLSPEIVGTGSATGSATWSVNTNNAAGWKLEVNAGGSPALASGANSFADYTEEIENTPETWSVANGDSEFGFTASGDHAGAGFTSGTKYQGFNSTTKIQVASDTNPATNVDTTVGFKAEVGSSHTQAAGTYEATITATATTL